MLGTRTCWVVISSCCDGVSSMHTLGNLNRGAGGWVRRWCWRIIGCASRAVLMARSCWVVIGSCCDGVSSIPLGT